MKIEGHWLSACERCVSPHYDERPQGESISLLVIHNISLPPGEFGGRAVCDLFQGKLDSKAHPYFEALEGLRVSAHLLIQRDGQVIQFVPFHQRAWHAGASCYQGRENCNDFAVGIELEGVDDVPYTDEQYQVLADISIQLFKEYPAMSKARVAGHCDIAPRRKTDPGAAFDWQRYYDLIESLA